MSNKTTATCSKCGVVEHNEGRCPTCGRMCKGHAPKRDVKKATKKVAGELTKEDKKQLKELILAKDMSKLSAWFAEKASSAEVAFKYVKELAPYIAPKLSSVQSEVKQDTTIQIQIQGFGSIDAVNTPKIAAKAASDVIEGEILDVNKQK